LTLSSQQSVRLGDSHVNPFLGSYINERDSEESDSEDYLICGNPSLEVFDPRVSSQQRLQELKHEAQNFYHRALDP
jgi:hypothetical protein